MKKYIVRVQYTKDPSNLIWYVRAKNDKALENIMAKEYAESLSMNEPNDNCYGLDGYEYERVNNRMFKKDFYLMCGTWIGADVMRDDLRRNKK